MARWLVHLNDWGVVSTSSVSMGGVAFGNVLSMSDGTVANSTGVPMFYLSRLDLSTQDLLVNSSCSLTVTQLSTSEGCSTDPEDPTCAKLTLTGQMVLVGETEQEDAQAALFSRHPEMRTWPAGHDFQFWKLQVHHLFLLDFYGGAPDISVEEYYAATLQMDASR
mmetsp:Transcript_8710/g.32131  ORF Transcript_8710/g.32131 Transcript_8710/m.32131 type:complete len:165 (+) Transcript_8710:285-779(+)